MSAAFSTGTEFQVWSVLWCETCRNDTMGVALPSTKPDVFCPIVSEAMIGETTPAQWTENDRAGLATRYVCTEYEPRDPADDARAYVGPDGMRSAP